MLDKALGLRAQQNSQLLPSTASLELPQGSRYLYRMYSKLEASTVYGNPFGPQEYVFPLKQIEYGSGYSIVRSPYSIYLGGAVVLHLHFLHGTSLLPAALLLAILDLQD